MKRYKVEMAINLIVEADNHTEALDKASKYVDDQAHPDLNSHVILLEVEVWDDDNTPTDVK